jgi:hypothetical protein
MEVVDVTWTDYLTNGTTQSSDEVPPNGKEEILHQEQTAWTKRAH